MGRRGYKRFRVQVPVTVNGLDLNGNPFTQSATTVEISARGLCLSGVTCLRGRRGEQLTIRYKNHSARYRLAWVGEYATPHQGLVGLESLEDSTDLFADQLPRDFACGFDPRNDNYVVPSVDRSMPAAHDAFTVSPDVTQRCKSDRPLDERRRHARFVCSGTARIWEQGHELAINARVNEISLGGCYLEIMSPLRLDTAVRLELAINHRSVSVAGIVRVSQPNFGMGIEFSSVAPAEAEKLQQLIGELSGAGPAIPPASPAVPPVRLPDTVEEAVTRWFGSHDVLTRQEFKELQEQVARARGVIAGV